MPPFEQRLHGVCAAALTPLTAAYEPDGEALVRHCRRLLAAGCDAINLLGTTGEATSLSTRARIAAMEAVATGGLPLEKFMVGTGAAAFEDALNLTRVAVELGFTGALVIPPFYFKGLTDDGVFHFYARLIDTVGDDRLRLYLYHFPQLSGYGFAPALVARLVATYPTTIAGLKDSSGAPGFADAIVAACPALAVFPSSETVLADGRTRGYAGCISATVNVSAPLAARVWAGDLDAVPALDAIRRTIVAHQIVPALRSAVATLSGDEAWLRVMPPLIELPREESAVLLATLRGITAFAALREVYA